MKMTYRLVKLRTETVQELFRLKRQTGKASLDALIVSMIQMADSKRLVMMNTGWMNTGGTVGG